METIRTFLEQQPLLSTFLVIGQGSKHLDFDGELWRAVLSSTSQPERSS